MESKTKEYAGIDVFRVVAAVLVAAIHISPLASYNELADMALTKIAARTAVPFFFMTTGFFLLGGKEDERRRYEHLKQFCKKTGMIYVWAILLYLPVNIYTGYFQKNSVGEIVRDILVNGTFYHLWYLPAVVLGVAVTGWLLYTFGMKATWKCVLALYLAGLLGDSYYGISHNLPIVRSIYEIIFHVCNYTRNGLFFAPVYLLLGACIKRGRKCTVREGTIGLCISSVLLFIEAFWLHSAELPRHDSMYIMLVPVMYFLFSLLLHVRGRRRPKCADIALAVYVIHPLVIIGMRGAAKLIHQEKLLVENSLIQFVSVTVVSMIVAAGWSYSKKWIGKRKLRS